MGKPHIDRGVSVATTYPAIPRSWWHSGSLASSPYDMLGQEYILPNRAEQSASHPSGTSCLPSQSMGISGRMRQNDGGCGAILNCSLTSMARAQKNSQRSSEKAKTPGLCQHQSIPAALIASGALDEKERDTVCQRCNRELYAFR